MNTPVLDQFPGFQLYVKKKKIKIPEGLWSSIHSQLTFEKASGVTVTVPGLMVKTKKEGKETTELKASLCIFTYIFSFIVHV